MIVERRSGGRAGLEKNVQVFFSRQPNCIFKSFLKVVRIETSTSVGYLQKFERVAEEF